MNPHMNDEQEPTGSSAFMGREFSMRVTPVVVEPAGIRLLAWKFRRFLREGKWHRAWIAPTGMPILHPDGHVEEPVEQVPKFNNFKVY